MVTKEKIAIQLNNALVVTVVRLPVLFSPQNWVHKALTYQILIF